MQLKLGSTRALACFDRRPRRSKVNLKRSRIRGSWDRLGLVGESANHGTRGRVRSLSPRVDAAELTSIEMKMARGAGPAGQRPVVLASFLSGPARPIEGIP